MFAPGIPSDSPKARAKMAGIGNTFIWNESLSRLYRITKLTQLPEIVIQGGEWMQVRNG